jgi:hypothetical protein
VGTWSQLPTVPDPVPGLFSSTLWTGHEFLIFGETASDPPRSANVAYNPTAKSWRHLSSVHAPSTRANAVAVWTGTKAIVYGGGLWTSTSEEPTTSGAVYDPSTDSWQPIASSPLPAQLGQEAVWTGSEMLVWGGLVPGKTPQLVSEGAAYNPTTNMWRMLSDVHAPAARTSFSTVWTGTVMIVWGGVIGQGTTASASNSGAAYDPKTNQWTAIPTAGAPAPRFGQSAFWTGGAMLIWGGATSKEALNTGGLYDPVKGSWSAMSTQSAPVGRTAAGTAFAAGANGQGGELYVWGGLTYTASGPDPSAGSLKDGARYDVSANTWTALPDSVLTSRAALNVSWTGDELLVWGGAHVLRGSDLAGDSPLFDGATYQPPQ